MALQLPPLEGYATALHPIKQAYDFDEKAADALVGAQAVDHRISAEQFQTIFEVTGNKLMELIGAVKGVPIAESRFLISFNLDGKQIVIDDNNAGWRLLRGYRKRRVRTKMHAILRPVIEQALRPYGLPNKGAYVSKLVKIIVLEYLNLISDRRVDLINGKNFRIERIERK